MSFEDQLAALLDAKLAPLVASQRRLTEELEQLRRSLPRQLLPISEAARQLGLHRNTVRNWANNGTIPSRKVGSKTLVDISAVQHEPDADEVAHFTGLLKAE